MEAEREATRIRFDALTSYVTNLGASMGRSPPPDLFAPPPRPYQFTHVSLTSLPQALYLPGLLLSIVPLIYTCGVKYICGGRPSCR
jgi:hypothetical protein